MCTQILYVMQILTTGIWYTVKNPRFRHATLAVPIYDESENTIDSESSDKNIPLSHKIPDRYKHEIEDSENEENIPLMELAKRIKTKQETKQGSDAGSTSAEMLQSSDEESTEPMQKDKIEVMKKQNLAKSVTQKNKVKNLLRIISDLI